MKHTNIIVIPYRDRMEHLKYYVQNVSPLVEQHMKDTKIVVVEQEDGKLFNRGKILNVGFKEYINDTKYFITNDVDIVPTKDIINNVYTHETENVYRIFSGHNASLGGVVKIPVDILKDINGFPNNIYGWGIEDRALYHRSKIRGIKIDDYNQRYKFTMLKHKSNAVNNYTGEKKKISDMWLDKHIDSLSVDEKNNMVNSSGLNTLDYVILKREELRDNVEKITVRI